MLVQVLPAARPRPRRYRPTLCRDCRSLSPVLLPRLTLEVTPPPPCRRCLPVEALPVAALEAPAMAPVSAKIRARARGEERRQRAFGLAAAPRVDLLSR